MYRHQNQLANHGHEQDVRIHSLITRISGTAMSKSFRSLRHFGLGCALLTCMLTLMGSSNAQAQTTLTDTPLYSTSNVPANLMLALEGGSVVQIGTPEKVLERQRREEAETVG